MVATSTVVAVKIVKVARLENSDSDGSARGQQPTVASLFSTVDNAIASLYFQ